MDQPTQVNDNTVQQAGTAVANSLTQFEGAMDNLADRVESTGEQVQRMMEVKDRAESILNQVTGLYHRAVNDVKQNPRAYLALAAIAGLYLLSSSNRVPKNNVISELVTDEQRH